MGIGHWECGYNKGMNMYMDMDTVIGHGGGHRGQCGGHESCREEVFCVHKQKQTQNTENNVKKSKTIRINTVVGGNYEKYMYG